MEGQCNQNNKHCKIFKALWTPNSVRCMQREDEGKNTEQAEQILNTSANKFTKTIVIRASQHQHRSTKMQQQINEESGDDCHHSKSAQNMTPALHCYKGLWVAIASYNNMVKENGVFPICSVLEQPRSHRWSVSVSTVIRNCL